MRQIGLVAVLVLGLASPAMPLLAGEQTDHYEAKSSETLEQAVQNFSEYNKKLVEVLSREKLSDSDMEEVHRLTYTLEVALAKINEEMSGIVNTLEEVHLSSEERNAAKLRGVAEDYLAVATTVIP